MLTSRHFADVFRIPRRKHSSSGQIWQAGSPGNLTLSKVLCFVLAFGAVFAIPSAAQTLTTLVNFNGTDGAFPESSLVQGTDGNFYGTTTNSVGGNDYGTVFKMTPSGALTTIYYFCLLSGCSDGASPYAGLIQARDGNFYGTTSAGGANSFGTVFKITPSGTLATIYRFCSQTNCVDGSIPRAGLIQAPDGNFYGTTSEGGTRNEGTVFKITPSGTLTTLHSFCTQANCADGAMPYAGLVRATDGNFYGTTLEGGSNNGCFFDRGSCGTVFKITPGGTLTTLYSFCAQSGCADGGNPFAGLVQASDGNFYGTTSKGGDFTGNCIIETGCGTVFKITANGTLTTLHMFDYLTDGSGPFGSLVQATDGNFYGTTSFGGDAGVGTIFEINSSGTLSTLHQFAGADGANPYAGLIQATDLSFYGTTAEGGTTYLGTVFRLSILPPSTTSVTSSPNPSQVGQLVTITATVGPAGPPTPTGTVSFTSNGTAIPGCTSVLLGSSLTAVCMTSTMAVGTDAIVATYSGDSNYSGSSGMLSQIVNPPPVAVQFVPVTPCRVYDSRPSHGGTGAIQGGTSQDFNLPQLAQAGPCASTGLDLSSAAVYSLNITVIPQGTLGYLTLWPTGEGRPTVSTLNSVDGRVKANAAITPAGTNGAVSVYVTNTTDVVIDIDGYFAPVTTSTLAFYPLTPCRVADTRLASYPRDLGPPALMAGVPRSFPILESTTCIPPGINPAAYSFNFTVVPINQHPIGYLSVWPNGQSQPVVSTLNDQTGTIVANAAIVPAGTDQDRSIWVFSTDGTQLLIDINGYFAAPGTGGLSLYALTPCRALDTRHRGSGQPFSGNLTPPLDVVTGPCGPPATAQAYVFNATVVPVGPLGYLALWPDGESQPVVSTLNAVDGAITNNMAIVPTTNGSIDAYAGNGLTQLLLDLSSYFAP